MNKEIKLNQTIINQSSEPYFIAEIGSNHNQDLGIAKELIHISADCGANAVKFQSLNLERQYSQSAQTEDLKKLFQKIKLDENWYTELAEEAKKAKVDFCSAPTYIESIELLEQVNIPFYKLASPQIRTFPTLINKVSALQKPILLSVGYCNYSLIERAIEICKAQGNENIILLHCVSEYPTKFEKVNLKVLNTLSNMFDSLVGISDHSEGIEVPVASVALGAKVIEKHITLSRTMDGPDHYFALEPQEFKAMVSASKNVFKSIGAPNKQVTAQEKTFANEILVRWYAKENIHKGELITDEKISFLRGTNAISDEHFDLLGNIRAKSDIKKSAPILWQNIVKD
ncbi:MAG: N-acetylneuraminate synthase family protein [bacterium]